MLWLVLRGFGCSYDFCSCLLFWVFVGGFRVCLGGVALLGRSGATWICAGLWVSVGGCLGCFAVIVAEVFTCADLVLEPVVIVAPWWWVGCLVSLI